MSNTKYLLLAALFLGACDSSTNPIFYDETAVDDSATGDTTEDPSGITGDDLPAGTASPSKNSAIIRTAVDGEADVVSYDASTRVLTIENLPFDGDGNYQRSADYDTGATGGAGTTAGGYGVFENANIEERRAYHAIYGTGDTGTRFAIVGTGAYEDYGYSGYTYQRDAGITIPTSGQATFNGGYAGIMVFDTSNDDDSTNNVPLHFTEGNVSFTADFTDFIASDAVEGVVTDRYLYDQNGNTIATMDDLFLQGSGITAAGEMTSTISLEDTTTDVAGNDGNWYALLSGDPSLGGAELVGIITLNGTVISGTSNGQDLSGFDFNETGGFIAVQQE
ncbi:hypothetical protein AQS8620_02142 [Aquimixticola soesokkakensis]|uniref:Transferrin-binding protein B C-lobe/N-lobe beta barrel domain-containing protein n=1 Tax=Aquimixticola soesokkakensis TaxID=1519096 RepID=A0A1Y5T195_9RHOB|nr:hypothetical protein [Aquimixticola soesokkakensis]SLN49825.1 hypothetical protein AQS8620_02142 [Aquimixticola soesokkakensis]